LGNCWRADVFNGHFDKTRSSTRRQARYHSVMDTKLLELLVCPVTKGPLDFDRERQELQSRSARLAYPVRNGIPILLENEARTLSDEEIEQLAALRPAL
jgi:uncharacterized protein YbaR (Trm112 family)